MAAQRKLVWISLSVIFLVALPFSNALAESSDGEEVPPGFNLISSTTGVKLYRKDYANGNPDFVQVVDLSRGAQVKLLVGEVREPRPGKGAFGGDDPRIQEHSLEQFWQKAANAQESAYCVTNGTFFYMKESPTRLPFSLKVDGTIVSDGYAKKEFEGQKLMLEIWDERVEISALTFEALYNSSAPNIVGGLMEDASKNPKNFVGRTFVGVVDDDQDGSSEIVLIFNTQSARQSDAAKALRSFGAHEVMMLDGGGSTQLICEGKGYISSDRFIPQALAVMGGQAVWTNSPYKVSSAQDEPQQVAAESLEQEQVLEPISASLDIKVDDGVFERADVAGLKTIEMGDVVWVPVSLLTVGVFILLAVLRIQHV